jgi:oligosaccharide 4-alpha-D-glucosyltransferase
MLFERFAAEYPDKRLFSLNRSGFAGTQRYSIFPWTGDVSRSWSGLQAQLPILQGMSMSGIPYIHSDAGGFAGGEKDPELYVRWLQFAQYTPIFKPHGTELSRVDTSVSSYPSEPALFPQPYLAMAKKAVDERYALMPYNYTLAYEQATGGHPLISPLYYYFSDDTASYGAQDEYMWGKSMLVAPVTEKGATSRKVYLPKGTWYNYKTLARQEGGTSITEAVDMESIPVYVKAGSFITTNNTWLPNTAKYNTSDITVTYFPSADFADYTLYDDDGSTNKAIGKNLFEMIKFETEGWGAESKITIRSNGGKFTGKPASRKITLAIPGLASAPATVTMNGKPSETTSWESNQKVYRVTFSFTGDPLVIIFK